jgi:protein O-mannosyl-transferase
MARRKKKPIVRQASPVPPGIFASSISFLSFLAGGMLAGLTFLAYFPSLGGGFILDDKVLLTQNPLIKASNGLFELWCTTKGADYWPLTYSTFWLEWRLWGMNPMGYHVVNVVLHICCCFAIWAILRKLSVPGAFFAALLFALHSVNVESVAWISQRKNLMAMVFFLLSILWYLKSEEHSSPLRQKMDRWYWLSLLAFLAAMLSKGSVAILPLLLILILWWQRPLSWRDLLLILPFFAIAAILTAINIWFQSHGTGGAFRQVSWECRLLGAGGAIWFYLYKAGLPLHLLFVFPQWQIDATNPLWWLPLAAAVIVSGVFWHYRNGWGRPLLFAWGFFCIALLPVMGFIDASFMEFSLVADHYQHLALIAVVALAAALWNVLRDRVPETNRWAVNCLAVGLLALLAAQTWRQNGDYRNEIALYEATLAKNPNSAMAHYSLGVALVDEERWPAAKEHFAQALKFKPDYYEAHNNLGGILALEKHYQEAIYQYRQALRLNPNFAQAHNNLGSSLMNVGRFSDAILEFQEAVRCQPDYLNAYVNLAMVSAAANHSEEALAAAEKALEIARSQRQLKTAATLENWLNEHRQRGN